LSADLGALIPELQPFARELVRAAGAAGLMPRVTSTLRSTAEQTRLYRRYQSGLQSLPVAPPGTSAHEFGWAFDMIVTPMEYISDVGAYWTGMGGKWGGQFNDPVHFEYPGFHPPSGAGGGAFEPSAYDKIINFATGFIPYVGGAQMAASILGMFFPGLKQTELYDMIENPFLNLEKWASVQRQWIG
jgi:hypothetical protein